ncbi:acyl-CoA thioesterase [Streptomyces sp. 3214.6]|uniref:acyl-CoA thioesterase n=1 Tax=Streptomyces sp. 3214.6 TaxID=1882757 RepID=UPI00090CB54B|nr:acyl-CoA thioesterase domain-containing protein [Streptomyces sp. 3214.6]SHI26126.1 acyl-CoA thioesterase-2 [Streptomyces sp. 3214.6]
MNQPATTPPTVTRPTVTGPRATDGSLDHVLAALALTETEPDTFLAPSATIDLPRLFGGQILAQTLLAAARTVDRTAPAHSLHAHFLRPGHPERPVRLTISRLRDGNRLHSRAVTVTQEDRTLATATVSFAAPSTGVEHQRPAPASPPPESLPSSAEWDGPRGNLGRLWATALGLDVRVVPDAPGGSILVWHRTRSAMADDDLLHQALLVYMSDVTTLSTALVPHGVPVGSLYADGRFWEGVTLDHAMWFHRPARADEWLLFAAESPAGTAERGLVRSDVYTLDGTLVASLAQQGLFRVRD